MSHLTAFCTQLINLLTNLNQLYPDDNDITISLTSVNLLKSTNPRQLLNIFTTYVLKYEKNIIERDENFFLNTNLIEDCNVDKQDANYAGSVMGNLKKYWNQMDNESKENIWKYFQVLILLSKKC